MSKVNWQDLGFQYMQTNAIVYAKHADGQWHKPQVQDSPFLNLNIAATALHYGQSAIEGLKAFHGKAGKVAAFRMKEHCQRMGVTAERVLMPKVPWELFHQSVRLCVEANKEFIPPYETNGALYIRPILFGSGPRIGVKPAQEYIFAVVVIPVGDYYVQGQSQVAAVVLDELDRAAPFGLGGYKVAGNYTSGLFASQKATELGAQINLYLDAKENKYIEEFGTSNFIAITQDDSYVTPVSRSILTSITNLSLMQLAQDQNIKVEKRKIDIAEIESFKEWGACGTAVVITPVHKIIYKNEVLQSPVERGMGPRLQSLYDNLRSIQRGETQDSHGWMTEL